MDVRSPRGAEEALDRLLARGSLAPERRLLALAGAACAGGDEERAVRFFRSAIARGAAPERLSEIALQTHLFAGYPRAINALFALRRAAGAYEPLVEKTPRGENPFRARGEILCRTIYGINYTALRDNIRALHPDLDRWMVDEGYGRVLSRPGVDALTRELAALSALVVLDVPRQVKAHLRGSRNAGAEPAEIEEALEGTALFASARAVGRARSTWREIQKASRGRS